MQATYDTHCPCCREAITLDLLPCADTESGYFVAHETHPCVVEELERFGAWAERLEARSPAWWEAELERQRMRRNVRDGLQPALL